MPAGWLAQEARYGVTVVPLDDVVEHDNAGTDEDERCACGPRWDPVKRTDGSVVWVLVHHSLDGRELHEE